MDNTDNKVCLFHDNHQLKLIETFYNLPMDYSPMNICNLSFYFCSECGYLTHLTEVIGKNKALNYSTILKQEDRGGKLPDFKDLSFLSSTFKYISKNDEILEIGSNSGYNMAYIAREGYSIEAVELDPYNAQAAREKGFRIYNENYLNFKLPKDYKLFIISHVLEHIEDPKSFLNKLHKDMDSSSFLYIELPDMKQHFQNGTIYEFYHDHKTYADGKIWLKLLCSMGFELVEEVDRKSYKSVGFIMKKTNNIQSTEIKSDTDILKYLDFQHKVSAEIKEQYRLLKKEKVVFYPLNIQPTIMSIYENPDLLDSISFFIDDNLEGENEYLGKRVYSLESAPIDKDTVIVIGTLKQALEDKLYEKVCRKFATNKIVRLLSISHEKCI